MLGGLAGAIGHLIGSDGYVWAKPGNTLAQLKYRSYSAADVGEFFSQCKECTLQLAGQN